MPDGLANELSDARVEATQNAIDTNTDESVTWLHSDLTHDRKHTVCICDALNPEAIRRAAERNKCRWTE